MNKLSLKNLTKYGSTIIFFIIILVIIFLFFRLILNSCYNNSNIETFTGISEKVGYHNVLSSEGNENGILYFKRDPHNPSNFDAVPGAEYGYRGTSPQNYYLTQRLLMERTKPTMTPDITVNLFFDMFDLIWDQDAHKIKDEITSSFNSKGYYSTSINNKDNIYLIKHSYLVIILAEEGIDATVENVKDFCAIICQLIGYECFLEPVFSEDRDNFSDNMFYVLMKYQNYPIDACADNNSSHPVNQVNNWMSNAKQYRSNISDKLNISNEKIDQLINSFNKVSTGIPFYMGNCSFNATGYVFYNAISIDSNGLHALICTEDDMRNNKVEIGDGNYINSLKTAYEKYEAGFRDALSKDMSIFYKQSSLNNSEDRGPSSAFVWGDDVTSWFGFAYGSSGTSLTEDNDRGASNKFGFIDIPVVSHGLKANNLPKSSGGVGFSPDGISISNSTLADPLFYPTGSNSCLKQPIRFYKIGSNHKIYLSGNNNVNKLGIDTNSGVVYTNDPKDPNNTIFNIADYGLEPGDLVTNDTWCDNANNKGYLESGDILGVNGGNNQYVCDPEKKMRFYFDVFGTFHVEISLSRNISSQQRILDAFSKKFSELAIDYTKERTYNRDFLNNYNYSGTSLTHNSVIAAYLMFNQILVTNTESTATTASEKLGEAFLSSNENTSEMNLFYNKITTDPTTKSPWSKYINNIDYNTDCKNWFKHHNIFRNFIEIGIPGLIPPENSIRSIGNAGNSEEALNSCSSNRECAGVTCRTDNTSCELWGRGGIENNFLENKFFNNTTYDAYYKICPEKDTDLENSGFHQRYGIDFANTPLVINYLNTPNADFLTKGTTVSNIEKYVDVPNDVITKTVTININELSSTESNKCSWISDMRYNGKTPETMSTEEKITYISEAVIRDKDMIKILSSKQTNRAEFDSELYNQICNIILQKRLNSYVETTGKSVKTNTEQKNELVANNSSKTVNFNSNTISSNGTTENYSNINDNINEDSYEDEKYYSAGKKFIKKCVFNIQDRNTNNNNPINKNIQENVNTVLLTIFLVTISIIFFNIVKK